MGGDELPQHLIYHPSSPGFDIPDYLPLRRVKPLPKRKRSSPDPAGSLPLNTMLPPILPPPPGPDATAEELIAHAEVLSAQITFQSYFLPTLSGGAADLTPRGNVEMAPSFVEPPAELIDHRATPGSGGEGARHEGDHTDQMQQQGNAKKRKVPAHLSGSQTGPDSTDEHSGEEQQQQQQQPGGGDQRVSPSSFASPATATAAGAQAISAPDEEEPRFSGTEADDGRRGKVLPATMVGLRQKQVLKHRRRQLAALLDSRSVGDSLALDQALLANYALLNENRSNVSRNGRLGLRLIRRRASRVVRRHRTLPPSPPSEPTRRIFPDGKFTFLSSNAGVSFGSIRGACAHSTV